MEVTLEEWAEMNATRPDQALQDAARAAAKKAAEEAARKEQEAIEAEEEEARRAEVEKELEARAEAEGVDVDVLREQMIRKPGVKSADPMKRTSRGKRKRKRRPKSDD